ncbi:MAG: two-component regulator propeller domain-containing protein [Bacteroidota bacterium]
MQAFISRRKTKWLRYGLNSMWALLAYLLCACLNQSSSTHKQPAATSAEKPIAPIASQADATQKWRFDSMIRSIFQDSNGNLWFGSDAEGACRYDGHTFAYFSVEEGMSHNQIRTIQEDQEGNIWFATGYGISKYDGQSISVQTADNLLGPAASFPAEWKKEPNDLWFNGEVEGGIYRYDGQHFTLLEFPMLDEAHESFSIQGTVTGICEGKNNGLWMANYGGVIGYDGKDFKFINEKGIKYHVRSILEDSRGHLWIGNNGIGVQRYDGTATINFSKQQGVSKETRHQSDILTLNRSLNHVFAIEEDQHGNIWFGDRDTGAWRYDGKTLTNFTAKDGLPNPFVRVIYKDKQDKLWFGLPDGIVCTFNGTSFDRVF